MRKLSTVERRQRVSEIYPDDSLPLEERSSRALGKRFGVSHRTILNDLKAAGIIERHEKQSGAGLTGAALDERIAELYPDHSSKEIAAELGCSDVTVIRRARALGLVIRKPAPRRKHPEPVERECECGCGEMFTPTSTQVAEGTGRFKKWEHYTRWKRSQVDAVAAVARPLWEAGLTLDEIAVESGCERHRVWYALRVVGDADGRRSGAQIGKVRIRGRRVRCKARGHDFCPHGESSRWVFSSLSTEFLSSECWGKFREAVEWKTLLPLLETRPAGIDGIKNGRKRRKWKNRKNSLLERQKHYSDAQRDKALRMLREGASIRKTLTATRMTKHQVEDLIGPELKVRRERLSTARRAA